MVFATSTFLALSSLITYVLRIVYRDTSIFGLVDLLSISVCVLCLLPYTKIKLPLISKNPIIFSVLLVLFCNLFLSLFLSIFFETGYWLQAAGLNVRNILYVIYGLLVISIRRVDHSVVLKLFALFLTFGVIQNVLGMLLGYGYKRLESVGIGISYYSLIGLFLVYLSRSFLAKLWFLIIAFIGNSFTSFLVFFSVFSLRHPLLGVVPLISGFFFLSAFLAGAFGKMTIFRKSPEVLLSGTGRFEKYSECYEWISSLRLGGEVCHGLYLTLVSRYGFLGILEVFVVLTACIIYFSIIWREKTFLKFFPLAVFIFVAANDFILNTPSTLTIMLILSAGLINRNDA